MSRSTSPITIREADTVWHEQGGWLDARWHFSFDRYRDPEQMGVGALRVSTTIQPLTTPSGVSRLMGRTSDTEAAMTDSMSL